MQNMQVLVLVLNEYELLDQLLIALNDEGIKGATVIHSAGMAQVISKESDAILGSIRALLTPKGEENRTIFMVLNEDKIRIAKKVIYKVLGPLDKPGKGILFAFPVVFVEGILN